jgi:hypothetical protein
VRVVYVVYLALPARHTCAEMHAADNIKECTLKDSVMQTRSKALWTLIGH